MYQLVIIAYYYSAARRVHTLFRAVWHVGFSAAVSSGHWGAFGLELLYRPTPGTCPGASTGERMNEPYNARFSNDSL